jgi:hypothetical protein
LTYTIRKYNPTIKIYAVTPSRYSIGEKTHKHIEKYNIKHINCPELHNEVKDCKENIFIDIIKPKSLLFAKKYVTEDFILYLDNDAVCFGDLYSILEKYTSSYFCPSSQNVLSTANKNSINLEAKYRNEAKKFYSLIDNTDWFNYFPSGWFILHNTQSNFWQHWLDTILMLTNKINGCIVSKLKDDYIYMTMLNLVLEASLYKLTTKYKFEFVNTNIAHLCYFNKEDILNPQYPLIYNYGGFNQYAYHISHIEYINKFLLDNNININHTSRGPLDDESGQMLRIDYK